MDFASHLRSLRRWAGLTQAELAERVGVHRLAYSRLERGTRLPDGALVARIIEALDAEDDDREMLVGLAREALERESSAR